MALDVFDVSRLLAHHHDLRVAGTFAEDRLRRPRIEIAGAAPGSRLTHGGEGETVRQDLRYGRTNSGFLVARGSWAISHRAPPPPNGHAQIPADRRRSPRFLFLGTPRRGAFLF